MALDIIPKQEGGKLKAVASGVLPSGQPVVVNADGTVSVVGLVSVSNSASSPTVFNAAETNFVSSAFDSSSNKIVIVYDDNQVDGKAIVGTVSGTSISFGSEVVFNSAVTSYLGITFDSSNGKVVIAYRNNGNSGYGTAIVGTVSGNSISFGTPAVYHSAQTYFNAATFDSSNNKVVITYSPGTIEGKAIVATVSGTSISFGSAVTYYSGEMGQPSIVFDSSNNKVVVAHRAASNSNIGNALVGTVSGTSISFGSAVTFNNANSRKISATFDSNSNKVVIAYRDGGNSNYGTAIVGTVSGTSISFGSEVVFEASYATDNSCVFNSSVNKVVISYYDSTSGDGKVIVGTVSGTSISFTTATVFDPDQPGYIASVYDPSANRVVIPYKNNGNSGYGEYVVFQTEGSSTNLTSENYIGMSGGVVDVETVTQAVGSSVVYENAATTFNSAAFDSNSNKVVIAYRDGGNSGYGTAVVGTVSGTSISFGTPVVFNAGDSYDNSIAFDSNANKVVVAYRDGGNSNYGTAIVGTVSGTSISFGSESVFNAVYSEHIAATFDSSSNKIVIVYQDSGNSDYGTAIVGTVSGTSISFGSPVVFQSANSKEMSVVFDSNSNKIIVAYKNDGNFAYGTAVIGTVSGTSISFGTPVVFENGATKGISATFDSTSSKVVIAYTDDADSDKGKAVVGTVSGTSISFGTAVEFESSNVNSLYISASYDSNANKVVVAYRDGNNSTRATVVVGTVSDTSISFGSEVQISSVTSDYISTAFDSASNKVVVAYTNATSGSLGTAAVFQNGFTDITRGQVASGDAATVDIVGTVSTNQVGLTAGQQYYVQTDGTIGETPADPSVLAGTAISADKLIVKT